MFNSEKQFTSRASKIAFEETFMSIDSPDTSFDPSIGYRFGYPQHWLSDPSQKKMIGIRSLYVTPTSHTIELFLNIYEDDDDPVTGPVSIHAYDVIWSITQYNNLEEMLHLLVGIVVPVEIEATTRNFKFVYSFDQTTGNLSMRIIETDAEEYHYRRFAFIDPSPTSENIKSLLRFLNQHVTTENIDILEDPDTIVGDVVPPKTFSGVWDRATLFFHSSFSRSHRGMIGRNKDFWPTPSKKYIFRDNTNDFYIFFTTDGVHRIFPYHCNFYLELTFILNYDNVKV